MIKGKKEYQRHNQKTFKLGKAGKLVIRTSHLHVRGRKPKFGFGDGKHGVRKVKLEDFLDKIDAQTASIQKKYEISKDWTINWQASKSDVYKGLVVIDKKTKKVIMAFGYGDIGSLKIKT